jgi:hypothetical protein
VVATKIWWHIYFIATLCQRQELNPIRLPDILQYALATLKKKSRMFDVNREFALDKSLTYGTCQFVFYPVGKNIKRE